jgi:hypothetical protein
LGKSITGRKPGSLIFLKNFNQVEEGLTPRGESPNSRGSQRSLNSPDGEKKRILSGLINVRIKARRGNIYVDQVSMSSTSIKKQIHPPI